LKLTRKVIPKKAYRLLDQVAEGWLDFIPSHLFHGWAIIANAKFTDYLNHKSTGIIPEYITFNQGVPRSSRGWLTLQK